jgi:hypothetical protein
MSEEDSGLESKVGVIKNRGVSANRKNSRVRVRVRVETYRGVFNKLEQIIGLAFLDSTAYLKLKSKFKVAN